MPDAQPEQFEPDYRASLAAERTYLAYLRTGLALVAAGVALAGALPDAGGETLRRVLGVVVVVIGGGVFGYAQLRWRAVEKAMREQRALPRSGMAHSIAWVLVVVALGAVVVTLAV